MSARIGVRNEFNILLKLSNGGCASFYLEVSEMNLFLSVFCSLGRHGSPAARHSSFNEGKLGSKFWINNSSVLKHTTKLSISVERKSRAVLSPSSNIGGNLITRKLQGVSIELETQPFNAFDRIDCTFIQRESNTK